MPLVVSLSSTLGKREVNSVQCKLTNSDAIYDYGRFEILNDSINEKTKECILVDDILGTGETTKKLISALAKRGIKVVAVYAIVADRCFEKNIVDGVDYNYVYELKTGKWVHFFWNTCVQDYFDRINS